MSWGSVNVKQRRIEFVIRAASGREAIRALCREFEISPQTGYKWVRRYREAGTLAGVEELSRRPQRSPQRTAPEVEALVVQHRQQRPDWGARKLRKQLEQAGVPLETQTIHRI